MKRMIFAVSMLVFFSVVGFAIAQTPAPTPWITINDSYFDAEGRPEIMAVSPIAINVDSNGFYENADWWIIAIENEGNILWYDIAGEKWKPIIEFPFVSHSGTVFDLEGYPISTKGLDVGKTINFFFFIDTIMDLSPTWEAMTGNIINYTPTNDCIVVWKQQMADHGLTGDFLLGFDYSSTPSGPKYFYSQEWPDTGWIMRPVGDDGFATINYLNGGWIEGSILTGKKGYGEHKCSQYLFNDHIRLQLGQEKVCPCSNTGDTLILNIEYLGDDTYRVFMNFAKLPIRNYQQLLVEGQVYENKMIWSDQNNPYYTVVDEHPCYYTDVYWPSDSKMEFTFCAIKENGERECIPPEESVFYFNGHFAVKLADYKN